MRERAVDAVVALAVAAVLVAVVQLHGGIWRQHFDDLHGFFLPRYQYAAEAIVFEHRLPLWNPFEFCGSPLLASPQSGVLYPATLLFAVLPLHAALQTFYALHLALLAWGVVAYLGRHGVHRAAAAVTVVPVVALVFRGPGHLGVDHPNFIAGVAWLPAILLATENAVARGGRWLALGALAVAAQWLSGYPELSLETALLGGLIVLIGGDGPLPRRVAVTAAVFGLGAMLAAIQLLPLAAAVPETQRWVAPGLDALRVLARQFNLRALRDPWVAVPGAVLIAGTLLARRRIHLAWLAALAWCLLALVPPFALIYHLPGFSQNRFPSGWSNLGPVLWGFLVAAGLTALMQRGGRWRRTAAAVATATLLAYGVRVVGAQPAALKLPPPDYEVVAARARVLEALRAAGRLVSLRELVAGANLRYRLPSPSGFDPSMPPARPLRLGEAIGLGRSASFRSRREFAAFTAAPHLAARLGVGLVVVPDAWAGLARAAGFTRRAAVPPGGETAWSRPPLARVRLAHHARPVADDDAAVAALVDGSVDAATVVVQAADAGTLVLAEPPPGASESVRLVVDEPERLVAEAIVAAPGLVVIADTFAPGWAASVDGRPAPIVRADFAFRGVAVDAGAHRIELRYRPAAFRVGAATSALAFLVVVVVAAAARRRPLPDD
jgi:hypothetical protein